MIGLFTGPLALIRLSASTTSAITRHASLDRKVGGIHREAWKGIWSGKLPNFSFNPLSVNKSCDFFADNRWRHVVNWLLSLYVEECADKKNFSRALMSGDNK